MLFQIRAALRSFRKVWGFKAGRHPEFSHWLCRYDHEDLRNTKASCIKQCIFVFLFLCEQITPTYDQTIRIMPKSVDPIRLNLVFSSCRNSIRSHQMIVISAQTSVGRQWFHLFTLKTLLCLFVYKRPQMAAVHLCSHQKSSACQFHWQPYMTAS